ncbi:VOC family protein [Actinocorallia lasiicapitis]
MAIAIFKDLCVDAVEPAVLGPFWAAATGLDWIPDDVGEGRLTGRTPRHTVWINRVPEPKTVKHRIHLDVHTRDLAALEALGARPGEGFPRWTVMTDPEGGEFCAFVRDVLPADRIHGLAVDCADPAALAAWWGRIYGVEPHDNEGGGWWTLDAIPGAPFTTMDFAAVPERKTVKNRIHWDVTGEAAELVAAGATVLRPRDAELRWTVLADPEGNEFCAFTARDAEASPGF